jgi:hypothetical protein
VLSAVHQFIACRGANPDRSGGLSVACHGMTQACASRVAIHRVVSPNQHIQEESPETPVRVVAQEVFGRDRLVHGQPAEQFLHCLGEGSC